MIETTRLAFFALALASLALPACGAPRLQLAAATPGIALDPHLDKDIHEAARTYGPLLTRWGRWEEDEWYAVRWCPNPDQIAANGGPHFSPYRSRGHWTTNESQSTYGAPPGSPYWMSDDSDTWGDITMHHGWWVHLTDSPTHEWCWIPGTETTAGRVVWRSGEGFVGWAAESPTWVDDGGDDSIAALDWAFTFLGSLLELDLSSQFLEGEARTGASYATNPIRAVRDGSGSGRVSRVGPPAIHVHTARAALVAYASDHGGALPPTSNSEIPKSASSGTSSNKDSESATKKKKNDDSLPPGSGMYTHMIDEPMPSGMGPRYAPSRAPSPSSYPSSSSSSSSSPSSSWHGSSGSSASSGSSSHPSSASHTSSSHSSSSSSSSSSHSSSTHKK